MRIVIKLSWVKRCTGIHYFNNLWIIMLNFFNNKIHKRGVGLATGSVPIIFGLLEIKRRQKYGWY